MNIEYFAYYSVGGYKDMFLGTTGTTENQVYYSPFYCQWKAGTLPASTTDMMKGQLEHLDTLKHIAILSSGDSLMPNDASKFVAHSGFKLACCTLRNGKTTIALKDIEGSEKDENNRSIPFMLQLIGDDTRMMVALADYIRENLKEKMSFFETLFEYNVAYNCLQFNIGSLNAWVSEVIENKIHPEEQALGNRSLHRIVVSNGVTTECTISKLGLSMKDVDLAYNMAGSVLYDSKNYISPETNISPEAESRSSLTMDILRNAMRRMVLYPEDKEDIAAIHQHIRNIFGRHF